MIYAVKKSLQSCLSNLNYLFNCHFLSFKYRKFLICWKSYFNLVTCLLLTGLLLRFLVKSLSDQSLSILHLPSHMAKLLTTPTGHCFVCDSPYFTAAFHLKESADTALRIVQPNSTNLLRVRDTRWSFYFCCCSKICLDQVCSMRDSPD